ncbi:helix-turn-helix domain-containing protein [Janthinobacterium sp. PLB04]|uniref:Helix-turn-helix transcriptional regulator n=1 Tax=Janthinobacterium lividum TaxID=29581 RepID=A0AAJ4MU20_9BURK|nr:MULTISPECIES: helix-turn-helix transcriptional regulator [Janthinobacterium]KAB0331002.1 helix-turn-helix transcriptional regulator [Janthinobacterium lividum]QSX97214.1 helix-turn-helix transcriptional regulator [Janthinobacterium lividum]UGQ37138.1 helix-turn-helix domain-containing protein [Janthinobacterium sp. PLB04]
MRNASSEVDTESLSAIGQAIRAMRLEKHISQEELAHISMLDRSHLGRIERGERNLSILNLIRVARGLGCTPSAVLHRAGL